MRRELRRNEILVSISNDKNSAVFSTFENHSEEYKYGSCAKNGLDIDEILTDFVMDLGLDKYACWQLVENIHPWPENLMSILSPKMGLKPNEMLLVFNQFTNSVEVSVGKFPTLSAFLPTGDDYENFFMYNFQYYINIYDLYFKVSKTQEWK